MQYHIQTLVKHLFDKDSFEQVTVDELKQFTEEYPYAAAGQFLYAKKLKESGSYNHPNQSEQASLYFHNALWLRWQLDQKEEAPALAVKAEEAAQQPGFRIVVQMPKNEPGSSEQPTEQPAENIEQESTATTVPETAATEQTIQPAAEQTAVPAQETPVADDKANSLQVNEEGSLVENAQEEEQAKEAPVAETASAVAIAEEVMIPGAVTPEAKINTEEADDIVPAIEVTKEELANAPVEDDIIPAVDIRKVELANPITEDDIIPAIEVTPDELATIAAATAITETQETDQDPAEIAVEEQQVAEVTETNPANEPVAFTAETEQPVTAEPVIDNTTHTPPPAAETEPVVQQAPETVTPRPFTFTAATQEGKASVDLGEPVFESFHTIDYFASLGIKLGQEEFKDKLGKQLKSFTDWLRSMKRIAPTESTSLDDVTNQSIQRIAEHSVEEKEVLTEAMAEVWAKQGNAGKAIRVYEKLSLLNPAKSPYFAGRIEQLKAQ